MEKETKEALMTAGQILGAGYAVKKAKDWVGEDTDGIDREFTDWFGEDGKNLLHGIITVLCTITWAIYLIPAWDLGFWGAVTVIILSIIVLGVFRFGLFIAGWAFVWICLAGIALLIAPFSSSVQLSHSWEAIELALCPFLPWLCPFLPPTWG